MCNVKVIKKEARNDSAIAQVDRNRHSKLFPPPKIFDALVNWFAMNLTKSTDGERYISPTLDVLYNGPGFTLTG